MGAPISGPHKACNGRPASASFTAQPKRAESWQASNTVSIRRQQISLGLPRTWSEDCSVRSNDFGSRMVRPLISGVFVNGPLTEDLERWPTPTSVEAKDSYRLFRPS